MCHGVLVCICTSCCYSTAAQHTAAVAKVTDVVSLWSSSCTQQQCDADDAPTPFCHVLLAPLLSCLALPCICHLQGDLARMLYNNKTAGGYSLRTFAKQFMLTHMSRVTAVGEDWIELERPLHVDVSMTHPAVLAR